ncbi:MAG TPA: PD-(D/E)XK nuclease family protein [Firmicutes bacterium]|nr:PD-(D/E)XK nuclease family protein [Bacillota bacterium]
MEKFSPSRLKTYETCPRKYRFIYVDNLAPEYEKPRPELFLGNQIHAALRRFFELEPAARTLDTLHQLFRRVWASDGKRAETFPDVTVEREFGIKGLELLRFFHAHHDLSARPLRLEEWVECPLDDEASLLGKIDRIDEDTDGNLHLIDYKTGKPPTSPGYLRSDLQLPAYWLMAENTFGRPVGRVSYLYLQSPNPYTVTFTREELERFRRYLLDLVRRIRTDEQFLPISNPLCRFCDYQSLCPLELRQVAPGEGNGAGSWLVPDNDDEAIMRAVRDLPF